MQLKAEEVSRCYDRYVVSQGCGNKFMEDIRSPHRPGESKLHLEAAELWTVTDFGAGTGPTCGKTLIHISDASRKHTLNGCIVGRKPTQFPKEKPLSIHNLSIKMQNGGLGKRR